MTGLRSAALRQLALMFIAREVSSDVDPAAVATAARRAYETLVRVLTPLIGAMGVHALAGRAVRLAAQEHSWLSNTHEPEPASEAFDHILVCVERRDPASVADGAAAILRRSVRCSCRSSAKD